MYMASVYFPEEPQKLQNPQGETLPYIILSNSTEIWVIFVGISDKSGNLYS